MFTQSLLGGNRTMGMHSLIPKPSSPCPPHVPVRKILWGAHGGQSEEDLGMRIQDAHFQDVLISIILITVIRIQILCRLTFPY